MTRLQYFIWSVRVFAYFFGYLGKSGLYSISRSFGMNWKNCIISYALFQTRNLIIRFGLLLCFSRTTLRVPWVFTVLHETGKDDERSIKWSRFESTRNKKQNDFSIQFWIFSKSPSKYSTFPPAVLSTGANPLIRNVTKSSFCGFIGFRSESFPGRKVVGEPEENENPENRRRFASGAPVRV